LIHHSGLLKLLRNGLEFYAVELVVVLVWADHSGLLKLLRNGFEVKAVELVEVLVRAGCVLV